MIEVNLTLQIRETYGTTQDQIERAFEHVIASVRSKGTAYFNENESKLYGFYSYDREVTGTVRVNNAADEVFTG